MLIYLFLKQLSCTLWVLASERHWLTPNGQATHYRINQHGTNIEIEMSVSFSQYHIYGKNNDVFIAVVAVTELSNNR